MLSSTPHITWTPSRISPEARARQLGQRGVVVWLTGLSGSGKSTMAVGLDARLYEAGRPSFMLDGDNLRHGLCRDLDFSSDARRENIRRTGEVAKLMAQAGLIVICSLISPFAEDRLRARESCEKENVPFLEVYVHAPLAVCEQRDPKGLYRKARLGQIQGFTGIDSPYEAPSTPGLILDTSLHSPEECLDVLSARVLKLGELGV